jgi:hypothetical protein
MKTITDSTHQAARKASAYDTSATQATLPAIEIRDATTPAWASGGLDVAPNPLMGEHLSGLDDLVACVLAGLDCKEETRARIVSMMVSLFCACAAGACQPSAPFKPILTIDEAATMLGLSRKRLETIIYEEKVRLGRLPDFVCDAGGKIQRRIVTDEFLVWVKSRRSRRGRPPKLQQRGR